MYAVQDESHPQPMEIVGHYDDDTLTQFSFEDLEYFKKEYLEKENNSIKFDFPRKIRQAEKEIGIINISSDKADLFHTLRTFRDKLGMSDVNIIKVIVGNGIKTKINFNSIDFIY